MTALPSQPQTEYKMLPITAWNVYQVRATFLVSPLANIPNPVDWWETVCGNVPDSKNFLKDGTHSYVGEALGGRLTLNVDPMRVEWLLEATGDFSLPEIPSLGSVLEKVEAFLAKINPWLLSAPETARLAVGLIIHAPVKDRADGYRQLQPYLPAVKLDPEHSSDFFYQINRPRASKTGIEKLNINRLTRWSVAYRLVGQISTAGASGFHAIPDSNACRIEFDLNTAPDFQGDLQRDRLPQLLDELWSSAKEIIENGDIS